MNSQRDGANVELDGSCAGGATRRCGKGFGEIPRSRCLLGVTILVRSSTIDLKKEVDFEPLGGSFTLIIRDVISKVYVSQ